MQADRKKQRRNLFPETKIFNKQMQLKKFITLFFLLSLASIDFAASATSNWQENSGQGAKTRLVGSYYEKDGSKKLILGVHFKLEKGWKIYGKDDSGFGLPPSISFEGSKNYVSHQIYWPTSHQEEEKIGKEIIRYSAYKDEVVLPILVEVSKSDEPVEIIAKLDFGLCKEVCIPAHEIFSIRIPTAIDEEALREIQQFYNEKIVEAAPQPAKKMSTPLSLISAILLAIFGGAILNIMPCVLPVLSLKLISIIKHSNTPISRIRKAFISTIVGILFCFFIFAFLAVAIKITGNSLGWGLQFQNPYFLIFLIIFFMFFIANLLGIFEINFSQVLASLLNKKISSEEEKHHVFLPNFFSGILAVLLATPCSAPFLGAAISFALVQDFSIIFLIFLCIGIGFALPYIILTISPKLVYLLPKPGQWMVITKQVMIGLLIATIIWLLYILSHNLGSMAACIAVVLSLVFFFSFKIKSDLLKYFTIILTIIAFFSLPVDSRKQAEPTQEEYDLMWQKFDEAEVYRLVMRGKVVVVDITADWCLTCKFNKIRVLQDEEIMVRLKRGDIIGMRGDITKPDEEIMNFLHKNNRFAIPFNAVYGPGAKTGLLTSELLSKKELLELIEKAQ